MEVLEEKKNKNRRYEPILEKIPDWPVYTLSKQRKAFIEEVTDKTVQRIDRKSTRLNSSHIPLSRMPSSA